MLKDLRRHLRIYSIRKLYNLIMGKIQFSIGSTHLYYYPAKITISAISAAHFVQAVRKILLPEKAYSHFPILKGL